MAKELDLDDVCAGNPLAARQLAEMREGIQSDQYRMEIYSAEIAKLRAQIAKLRAERDELREAITGLLDAANRNVGGMVPGGIAYWCHGTLGQAETDETGHDGTEEGPEAR